MKFRIGWDERDKKDLMSYWSDILTNGTWSRGKYQEMFEEAWSIRTHLHSVSFGSWSGAALAGLSFFGIKHRWVVVPANTMLATVKACHALSNGVIFADVNREDLCMSIGSLKKVCERHYKEWKKYPDAVFIVHVGGHIAFDTRKIADYCTEHEMVLLEDCAHAHGAVWDGLSAGAFGDAGFYSFYATKTITTGEGGMLVTRNKPLVDYARAFRQYGRDNACRVNVFDELALNYQMSEFTAALGYVQAVRLPDIVEWKRERADRLNEKYKKHLKFPAGMKSGYYKYIVTETEVEETTGLVYAKPVWEDAGPVPSNPEKDFPNTLWVCKNHKCPPIFYNPGKGVRP